MYDSDLIWLVKQVLQLLYGSCSQYNYVSKHDLRIEAHHRNQPYKTELALYKLVSRSQTLTDAQGLIAYGISTHAVRVWATDTAKFVHAFTHSWVGDDTQVSIDI